MRAFLETIEYKSHQLLKRKYTYSVSYLSLVLQCRILIAYIEILESIEPNFSSNKSDICLNYIKNKFTSYRGYSYSPWDIIPSRVKERDKRSIIIYDTSGNLKPFFLWSGSYFKDIYKNQNFGIDIYIKKHNQGLIDKYRNQIECQIKDLLKD